MSLSTIATVTRVGAAAVAAVLAAITFAGDCKTFRECVAVVTAPSAAQVRHSDAVEQNFRSALRRLCARPDLAAMFEHSPCVTSEFTESHLTDPTPVGEYAALVALHSKLLSRTVEDYQAALGDMGGAKRKEVAETYVAWDGRRQQELEELLISNPTWGQVNRERRRQAAEKDDRVTCLRSDRFVACGARR